MNRWIYTLLALGVLAGCSASAPESQEPGSLSAPTGVALKNATTTSLEFTWNAVSGAQCYAYNLVSGNASVSKGTVDGTTVLISALTPGTQYRFQVLASAGEIRSVYSAVLTVRTLSDEAPVTPAAAVCVDAPLEVTFDSAPSLGTSGLVRVFKSDGTLVDQIDLADMAKMVTLEDGTMVPAGADADKGEVAIGDDYVFHTFLDALHSNQYRVVHYTPLRVKGKTLEIKLHNDVLSFGQSYYLTLDASVAGKAVEKQEFSVKAKPSGTDLSVKADGTGDFCTVQGALTYASTLSKDAAVTIEVGEGTYPELLFLRGRNNLTIKGVSREKTVIAYPNSDSYETGSGGSVASRPKAGASIGKSGGRSLFLVESCDNLVLENLTIENTYSIPSHKGQAETIYFNGDGKKLTVENCSLISWQDTFLCKGEVWVHNSLVAGHVDFIWGYPKVCLFEDCEIRSRAAGYIIQARVNNLSDKGFVFLNCDLTAEDGVTSGVYLGRSGGSETYYDNVTYVNCRMNSAIAEKGWYTSPAPNPAAATAASGWKEYGSTDASGKALSLSGRDASARILTAGEAEPYLTRAAVLGW